MVRIVVTQKAERTNTVGNQAESPAPNDIKGIKALISLTAIMTTSLREVSEIAMVPLSECKTPTLTPNRLVVDRA